MRRRMMNNLTPVQGCLIAFRNEKTSRLGICLGADKSKSNAINVRWFGERSAITSISFHEVTCGFKLGMDVIDATPFASHQSMGQGVILQIRTIGNNIQILVDFRDEDKKIWMPYQYLRHIKSARYRFTTGDLSNTPQEANRFVLRTLSHAIELWNENTGALSALDIDPLPHQVNLVHHILSSGNLNWLIADDVGLGKTIETGMIIHALRQRGIAKRILLITPAGLVKQWQEELHEKFRLSDFEVFGLDFTIDEPRKWKLHDFVIGSIDTLKSEKNLENLMEGGTWDLVIFDESHKLSRKQDGMQYRLSERYTLAQKLRKLTSSILLLTATPHQGEQDKFVALLELLRPERHAQFQKLAINPDIISDMVFRNHKDDVTDIEGNFIFQGKLTKAVEVPINDEFRQFDKELANYFDLGYGASEKGGTTSLAIGFVMTTYRKLASSSVMAIKSALNKRLAKLQGYIDGDELERNIDDERYIGELLEHKDYIKSQKEFFEGEVFLLKNLLDHAERLASNDNKLNHFMDNIIDKILANNPQEKILIFSEYRNTQLYLQDALQKRYGNDSVSLINGSMTFKERRDAIDTFENTGLFLISTEAGGEGINLQRSCHIMVNYDLPWNPMRLVQRIGRLYRYGQKNKVAIFNLYQTDSIDQHLIYSMYKRIDSIVNDLAQLQKAEFNEGLKDDILGELATEIDIEEILSQLNQIGIHRTEDRIEEALQKAKDASTKQREVLNYAASSKSNETDNEIIVNHQHIFTFVIGMLKYNHIDFQVSHDNQLIKIRFPEELQQKFKKLLGKASNLEATISRELARDRKNTHMLDLNSPIMQYFIAQAQAYDFNGMSINSHYDDQDIQGIFVALLKWQNLKGYIAKKQLCICFTGENEQLNPKHALDILLSKNYYSDNMPRLSPETRQQCKTQLKTAEVKFDRFIASNANQFLNPNSVGIISCALNSNCLALR